MKRLFLCSSGFQVLSEMAGVFDLDPEETTVAFVPTASNMYEAKPWQDLDLAMLRFLKYKVKIIDLEEISRDELQEALQDVDVLMVGGGNTFYLLDRARRCNFLEIVKEKVEEGMIYAGSSAGAVLACPDVEYVAGFDDPEVVPELKNYDGLDLISSYLMVHWGHKKYSQFAMDRVTELTELKKHVLCLKDNQGLVVRGDAWEIVSV